MQDLLRKRILVTGGAGFIGSHLCERLLRQNHDVICVDNFFTGRKANIAHLMDDPFFEVLRHDVCFPLYVEVDEIYNLACPASPVHYQHDPVQTTKTSVHGAINMLGLAKRTGARILQASTSEVYGDPQVHPQPETYWGHVNPIGRRSCYDEGKRCAETLFFDYHRQYKMPIKVARIFNSLVGDQKVIYYQHGKLRHETFADCYTRIGTDISGVEVPCFDDAGRMQLQPVSAIWRHHVKKRGYKISTMWGRAVKITEDHSLFTRAEDGSAQAVFGHELRVGDLVAVPRRLPSKDRPLEPFRISDRLAALDLPLSVTSEWIAAQCESRELEIRAWLAESGVASRQRFNVVKRYRTTQRVPMGLWQALAPAEDIEHAVATAGSAKAIKNQINNIDAFLWFLGFYVAEGCLIYRENNDYQLLFSSNVKYLEKLIDVVHELFGIETEIRWAGETRAPTVHIRSRAIVELVVNAFGFGRNLSTEKRLPDWVLQLPTNQLKHFLWGFWEGDGNHDAKTTGSMLIFNSSSAELIEQLVFILSKFGIVGSVTAFQTRVHRAAKRWYKAYRITVQGLDNYDLLALDEATQTLQADTRQDLAWARVTRVEPFEIDDWVYDFSVPGCENFVGGTYGICCHNTYGPHMHPDDGRVISNFVMQALRNEPITLYGDGEQTRSFCYVTDLVEGLIRLMASDKSFTGPVNLGNQGEYPISELAAIIVEMTGSDSRIINKPLPNDDPLRRKPDISLAREQLDWQPEVNLRDGLIPTVEYFRQLLSQAG